MIMGEQGQNGCEEELHFVFGTWMKSSEFNLLVTKKFTQNTFFIIFSNKYDEILFVLALV